MDIDLRGLFREAHMSNAILFFDECETIFRNRNQGMIYKYNGYMSE